MKKIFTIISAAAVCVSAFSCSAKKSSDAPEVSAQSFSAGKLSGVVYKKNSVKLPEELRIIYSMKPFNGSSEYFLIGSGDDGTGFWAANADLTSLRRLPLDIIPTGFSYDCDITEDGTVIVFSAGENGDFRLSAYSLDGTVISDENVRDYYSSSDTPVSVTGIASDGNIAVVCLDGNYEIFAMNGTHICALTLNEGEIAENIGKDSGGNLICAVRTTDGKLQLRRITSDGKTENSSADYNLPETIQAVITSGNGDYSMFLRSMTTIYGIKKSDSSPEALFSLNGAGLSADSIAGAAMCTDGNFIIPEIKYSTGASTVKKYFPCTAEELENIPAITVGMTWQSDDISRMAEIFNESRSDCRIEMKIYNSEDYDKMSDEITQDALSGNLPDIIRGTSLGSLDLLKNEALCDLYEFIDKDDTLTRDAFLPEYFAEIDSWYGGHIYNIPNFFRIKLPYTAKSKFLDGIETWDTAAFLDVVESIPAEMKPDINLTYESDTQVNRRQMLFVNHWMDYNTLECSFDTPEFARYIEFCKKGIPAEEYVEIPADEQIKRQEELATAFIDEKILFTEPQLLSYSDYLILKEHTFAGVDFGFMGNIGSGGAPAIEAYFSEALSITKDCSDKDAAWDFIKMFYTDEYYNSAYEGGYGFPVTVSGMKNFREKEKSPREYKYDEALKDYGGVAVYSGKTDENGTALYDMLGYVDDKIIAEADALISAAKLPKKTVSLPVSGNFEEMNNFYNEFYGIYFEETDRFFHGEITAEECGYMLQNRYSIYLSENFG